MDNLDPIRNYYDQNTRLFLRFGSSSEAQTIHRALWVEGCDSLASALRAADDLILACLPGPAGVPVRLADLGCGVGASLRALLERLPPGSCGVGLTISPIQARIGARQMNLPGRSGWIIESDFQALPLSEGFDLAYAIESFVHAALPQAFFREAARTLRPGGRLVLVDDFSGRPAGNDREEKWVSAYQQGWQVNSLFSLENLSTLAGECGFNLVESRSLAGFLRLKALPGWLGGFLLWLLWPFYALHPILPSMLGSMALQVCLKKGLVDYRLVVFERR